MVRTLGWAESMVGDRYSGTLSEMQETFSAMPEDSSVLEFYYTKSEMFSYMFRMSIDSYVNWETCETSFDSGRFRSALEFVNSFPAEFHGFDFEGGEERVEEEAADRWRSGQQMLSLQFIASPASVQALNAVFGRGGQAALVGYPTEDGGIGSFFQVQGRKTAMASTCRNKEAAWEFIRQVLLPQFHYTVRYIPINRTDYDKVIQWDVKRPKHISYTNYGFFAGNIMYPSRRVSDAEIERYEDFINRIDRIDLYDATLYNIVYEACGPYFAGDRSLDETIRLVENRVQLYVNESR